MGVNPKMTQLPATRVRCDRRDCVHYKVDDLREPGMCRCSHPEKQYHLQQNPCPLYRLNWTGTTSKLNLDEW